MDFTPQTLQLDGLFSRRLSGPTILFRPCFHSLYSYWKSKSKELLPFCSKRDFCSHGAPLRTPAFSSSFLERKELWANAARVLLKTLYRLSGFHQKVEVRETQHHIDSPWFGQSPTKKLLCHGRTLRSSLDYILSRLIVDPLPSSLWTASIGGQVNDHNTLRTWLPIVPWLRLLPYPRVSPGCHAQVSSSGRYWVHYNGRFRQFDSVAAFGVITSWVWQNKTHWAGGDPRLDKLFMRV